MVIFMRRQLILQYASSYKHDLDVNNIYCYSTFATACTRDCARGPLLLFAPPKFTDNWHLVRGTLALRNRGM